MLFIKYLFNLIIIVLNNLETEVIMKSIIFTAIATIFFMGCSNTSVNTQTLKDEKSEQQVKEIQPIKKIEHKQNDIKNEVVKKEIEQDTVKKDSRIITGQTALIRIDELDMSYLARIDTGATVTSLSAFNIKIIQTVQKEYVEFKKNYQPKDTRIDDKKIKNHDYKKDIGKKIHFDTLSEKGVLTRVKSEVVDVQTVRNAQGTEYRYVVLFTLEYKGISKKYRINLRDRRHMTYKLLIGRNWLSQHFLVNVDQDEGLLVPKK